MHMDDRAKRKVHSREYSVLARIVDKLAVAPKSNIGKGPYGCFLAWMPSVGIGHIFWYRDRSVTSDAYIVIERLI